MAKIKMKQEVIDKLRAIKKKPSQLTKVVLNDISVPSWYLQLIPLLFNNISMEEISRIIGKSYTTIKKATQNEAVKKEIEKLLEKNTTDVFTEQKLKIKNSLSIALDTCIGLLKSSTSSENAKLKAADMIFKLNGLYSPDTNILINNNPQLLPTINIKTKIDNKPLIAESQVVVDEVEQTANSNEQNATGEATGPQK